jgi:hypothetical protein
MVSVSDWHWWFVVIAAAEIVGGWFGVSKWLSGGRLSG